MKSTTYKNIEYEPLAGSSTGMLPPRRKGHSILTFSAGFMTAMLALTALYFMIYNSRRSQTDEEVLAQDWNYCGRSPAVAMERGCVMEPSFYGFMPPQCVYSELTNSLPIFEDRQYYSDMNMTQKLRPEQLYRGEYSTIYTARYHDEHCLFQWRKLAYALSNRMDYVDNKTIAYGHASHCSKQLAEMREPEVGNVAEVILGFYRCRKFPW